uniref:DH31-like receptor 2 n=1 Tax=Platynereis dumerilii TaxID=6359 RepID=A0A0K0PUL2_PLADU|nr:DH31-like receptor 2 [Platynereis dumerilii]
MQVEIYHNDTLPPPYTVVGTNESYFNYTDDFGYESDENEERFLFALWIVVTPILFGFIFIVGIAGNSLVVYVILAKPQMRSVTNLLLLNLAIADISFLLICIPFTAYKYVALGWTFGDVLCKTVKYFLYVTAYVTIYTLVAISVLRYLTIVWNTSTRQLRTKKNITRLILVIWLVILIVNAPVLAIHQVKSSFGYTYCGLEDKSVGPLFISFFVCSYVLPLFVICFLYLLIVWHLHKSKKLSSIKQERGNNRTTHVARVIFTVVLVFGTSWLPLHINSLVAKYGSLPRGSWYEVFRVLWNCLAYGNSCANPFIYNYVSAEFKRAFKETICCYRNALRRNGDLEEATRTELTRIVNGTNV